VDSQFLHESVIEAFDVGIEMVAAAGNNYGGECEYPAAYDEVVGVGAIDVTGSIANFSAIDGVDVWAPGVDILSSYVGETYKDMDGTSMATPHIIVRLLQNTY
jgi:subtilisin/minor extracellular protease Epr